jgi:hypothetical protein
MGPNWKSLKLVASRAWMFFGSQVKKSQFLKMCVSNVNTVLPSCFDAISFRSTTWCVNLPALLLLISRIMLMIPNGSGLGYTGAGLQPSFFASALCLYLVTTNVMSLYSIKATTGTKINEGAERILSAGGRLVATMRKLYFRKRRGIAVQYR